MELGFEGILETVLVGSIASLCLLLLLFLVFGHVLRIDSIRRIAQFWLYEREFVEKEQPAESTSEGHFSFAMLLLVAVLYGLGATVESITHDTPLFFDKGIKAEAFAKVGRGQVEGQTAPPHFVRFVTDDRACNAIDIEPSDGVYDSPCKEIYRQERESYYTAKNTVFQKEPFAHELSKLQSRIDFVRSACISLAILAIIVLLATGVAGIFERLVKDEESPPGRLPHSAPQAARTWREYWKQLAEHLKHLAAIRCGLITLLLAGLCVAAFAAWRKVEMQYDRRVFGYYLSLHAERRAAPHGPGAAAEDPEEVGEKHEGKVALSPLPSSPYRVFSGPWGEPFEPSAVRVLTERSQVLVANDQGGAEPFIVFSRERAGLVDARVLKMERIERDVQGLFSSASRLKFETLIPLPAAADGSTRVLALVDRPHRSSPALAEVVLSIDAEKGSATIESEGTLADPCDVAARDWEADAKVKRKISSCTIEAGVLRSNFLLLGVRYLIPKDEKDQKDEKDEKLWIPATVIVGMGHGPGGGTPAPGVIMKHGLLSGGPCARWTGISDMEILDDARLLVLTSVELPPGQNCRDVETAGDAPPVGEVQGALWLVEQKGQGPAEKPKLLHRFSHKPEGVTLLGAGKALVVFDDDGKRKSVGHAPETFPLETNESVYLVVDVPKPKNGD